MSSNFDKYRLYFCIYMLSSILTVAIASYVSYIFLSVNVSVDNVINIVLRMLLLMIACFIAHALYHVRLFSYAFLVFLLGMSALLFYALYSEVFKDQGKYICLVLAMISFATFAVTSCKLSRSRHLKKITDIVHWTQDNKIMTLNIKFNSHSPILLLTPLVVTFAVFVFLSIFSLLLIAYGVVHGVDSFESLIFSSYLMALLACSFTCYLRIK